MSSHELLIGLAKANLALSAAVLMVIILRKPTRQLFGARLAYGLWPVPVLAALAVLAPARRVLVKIQDATPSLLSPAPVWPAPVAPPLTYIPPAYVPPPPAFHLDPWLSSALVWMLGAALTALWLGLKQREFMAQAARGLAGPAVVGFITPRIVTPADFTARFSATERAAILAHEQVHLTRQDARINAATALVRCLCWFNPLVHLAAFLMRIDQELACDAAVIERQPRARRPYAEAMLKAELADRPLPLGCYWPAGARHPLTERIAMLKWDKPSAARRAIGALALAALGLGASAAAWAVQPAQVRFINQTVLPAQAQAQPAKTLPVGPTPAPELSTNSATKPSTAPDDAPIVQHGWRDDAVNATITLRSVDWSGSKVELSGVDDKTGQVWILTGGSTNTMLRAGIQPDQMSVGLSLKMLIDPQGGPIQCVRACSGIAREIDFPNGARVYLGGPPDPRRATAALPAGFLDGPPPGWHGFASLFDGDAPMRLTGRIVGIDYSGPYVELRVKADSLTTRYGLKGAETTPDAQEWNAEFALTQFTPAAFRTEIQAGDEVDIRGYAAKDKRCQPVCGMNARDVQSVDTGHKFSGILPPNPNPAGTPAS